MSIEPAPNIVWADDGLEIDGQTHEVVSEIHACQMCLTQQWGDYRESGELWQCRACGSCWPVGVTW